MKTVWLLSENADMFARLPTNILPAVGWQHVRISDLPDNQAASKSPWPTVFLIDVASYPLPTLPRYLFNFNAPVIAVLTDLDQRANAFQNGATDYVLYPFVAEALVARLQPYVEDPFAVSEFLLRALCFVNEGVSFLQALTDSLDDDFPVSWVASAGLYLWDVAQKRFQPVLSLRSLTDLETTNELDGADTAVSLSEEEQLLAYLDEFMPAFQIIPAAILPQPVKDIAAYLILALHSEHMLMGVIVFRCQPYPQLTPQTRNLFEYLGRLIGHLLEVAHLQEEAQSYAIQTAFIVLVARMLAEQSDLETILSLTLEHLASLLNASGGDIWLLTADGKHLTRASAMTSGMYTKRPSPVPMGQGLIGLVAEQKQLLMLTAPTTHPSFDARYDIYTPEMEAHALIVPLFHQRLLGVLQIYNVWGRPFTHHDTVLLEGVARLLASALSNAYLVNDLRESAEQQKALYEMSQQLADDLDLDETLHRALIWATRLCHVDSGLLWLVDETQSTLELAASHGLSDSDSGLIHLSLKDSVLGDVLRHGKGKTMADLSDEHRYRRELEELLPIVLRNALILPLVYHDRPIGVLNLVNKVGGPFDEADLTLLSTAKDMIVIVIDNARMHTHTIDLMAEREALHRHAIQSERLITVGRLTASLSHEINNPMQTIKGAINLAIEEMNDPDSVRNYLELSLPQVDRVVNLVRRMRQIYRPENQSPEPVSVNQLLQDTIAVAHKEMVNRNVKRETHLAENLALVWAVANQLHLVFLNIVLNMTAEIGQRQGGMLIINSEMWAERVRVELKTAVSNLPFMDIPDILHSQTPSEISFGLSFCRDIVTAHDGTFELLQIDDQAIFRIELPAFVDAD